MKLKRALFLLSLLCLSSQAQLPVIPAITVEQTQHPVFAATQDSEALANFRLRLVYQSKKPGALKLGDALDIVLPAGSHEAELRYESTSGQPPLAFFTLDGEAQFEAEPVGNSSSGTTFESTDKKFRCDKDYTIAARFQTSGDGTIFSKCAPKGEWSPGAKALVVEDGRLVYDIGGVGDLRTRPVVAKGKEHRVVITNRGGTIEIFLDGKSVGSKQDFTAPDQKDHVFRIGRGTEDYPGPLKKGAIHNLRFWNRSLEGAELKALVAGKAKEVNTPDLNWGSGPLSETFAGLGIPGSPTKLNLDVGDDFKITTAWVQPLEPVDHAKQIGNWNDKALAEGKQIYHTLCITCHGTPKQEGSLPTAIKFHEGAFKNGSDPYRMYQTLSKGYGMMVPQAQYSAKQKYAVIHYIREAWLKPHNSKEYVEIDATYLANLPQKLSSSKEAAPVARDQGKAYENMDFGPGLMWTYQVKPGNIAQKGIAIRLNQGPGGVSKGNAWMIYDHDTMRVAAAYTGKFVDWRGIAFDGSHGTHTSIAGKPLFINPNEPAWMNPTTGQWDDLRIIGRDGRRYGPLPRDWVHYKGTYYFGNQAVIAYTVGTAAILEMPGAVAYGSTPAFTRSFNIAPHPEDFLTLVAADATLNAALKGEGAKVLIKKTGIYLSIPASTSPVQFTLGLSTADKATVEALTPAPQDLTPFTKGGPARFGQQAIKTTGTLGNDSDAFAVDTISIPNRGDNPWHSWMRIGGFDFFPDNPDRAAVCTWMGDVWIVDGVAGDLKELTWRRICSGLFQPLGLKIVNGKIYVTCRDQLARLHDFNGDDEIDFVESFNNDHQVTEHFHEFAMGLQADAKGNFYYAKSARHAKTALVPHHGTLLRVSPDGTKTDIVATGFRAANGVCLNPDGTWIVTDQEGHWNPKNRINYVREGGFYGNMYGYHDVTDASDSAMEQPLCWVTNAKDRSPAELIWVPEDANWGSLNGTLLNLSYGYGMVYTVPHEILPSGQAQGGICELPIDRLATGTHRGRFHPGNKQLYVAGLFAWAGSQHADGAFYRIRSTGQPSYMPTKMKAKGTTVTILFSDDIPPSSTFAVKSWDLKRTKNYGSKHYNEKSLTVKRVSIKGRVASLSIPELKPTWGMEIRCDLGDGVSRIIHNSIHDLGGSR